MVDSIINKRQIAEVLWHDLWDNSEETPFHELKNFLPNLKRSTGYVVSRDNDECLILSTEVIPWSLIVEWQEFEVH
jgi:predicted MPP superfamily phosphohydrolase